MKSSKVYVTINQRDLLLMLQNLVSDCVHHLIDYTERYLSRFCFPCPSILCDICIFISFLVCLLSVGRSCVLLSFSPSLPLSTGAALGRILDGTPASSEMEQMNHVKWNDEIKKTSQQIFREQTKLMEVMKAEKKKKASS